MHRDRANPDYRSYLMRCRRTSDPKTDVQVWRCSLEDPHTGRRRTFGDVNAMLDAIRREFDDISAGEDHPPAQTATPETRNGDHSSE